MVHFPETLFDLDYPGHYLRRIKSVSITIPCVAGPYASVNCKLTLMEHRIRPTDDPEGPVEETVGGVTSIATSSGQNDSGLFEVNFRDERYLPFEGAGVDSQWLLEMPQGFRAFDYDTISDVVFHMKYTARHSDALKETVSAQLADSINAMLLDESRSGLVRLISVKREFGDAWHRFLNSDEADKTLDLELSKHQLPFIFHDKPVDVHRVEILLHPAVSGGLGSGIKMGLSTEKRDYSVKEFARELDSGLPAIVPVDSPGETFGNWTLKLVNGELDMETCDDLLIAIFYSINDG